MLLALTVIFMAPILVAWLMVFGPMKYSPAVTKNLGILLTPTVPFDRTGATDWPVLQPGEWLIVGLGFDECVPACPDERTAMLNMRLATANRAGRVYLAAPGDGSTTDTTAEITRFSPMLAAKFRQRLGELDPSLEQASAVLVDFHYDAVIAYGQPLPASDVLKDLKRLLKAFREQ